MSPTESARVTITPEQAFAQSAFDVLRSRYDNRHTFSADRPLQRQLAHPAVNAIAHFIVARGEAERVSQEVPVFNTIETLLRENWRVRQEHVASGVHPSRIVQLLKNTGEGIFGTAAISEIEDLLETLGIHLPSLLESRAGRFVEGEAITFFLHHFLPYIEDAVVEAETEYNPNGINKTLLLLAKNTAQK